ncbi:hypothetical protein GCM10010965_28690 [Caldalkalibacillus thermarum]|nr:hypothetical protein GCM10010965_28690 [Caldalkalibacillus thermarum]
MLIRNEDKNVRFSLTFFVPFVKLKTVIKFDNEQLDNDQTSYKIGNMARSSLPKRP